MNNMKTKALVEGAIFAAITVLIGLISFYIPLLYIISYVWAIPTIIISFRHGFRTSLISGISASVLLGIFIGPISGMNTFVMTLIPGMFLGYFMKKFKKQQNLIAASMVITVICVIVAFCIGALVAGVNPWTMYNNSISTFFGQFSEALEAAKKIYASAGISTEQLSKLPSAEMMIEMGKKLIIILLMVGGAGSTIFNLWVTKKLLQRMKVEIPGLEPISHWHMSNGGLLVVTISIIFILLSLYFFQQNALLMDISMNIATGLIYWFWFIGITTVVFFMDKLSFPRAIKVLLILLTALPLIQVYALIGYIESAFDFRKLRPEIIIKTGSGRKT